MASPPLGATSNKLDWTASPSAAALCRVSVEPRRRCAIGLRGRDRGIPRDRRQVVGDGFHRRRPRNPSAHCHSVVEFTALRRPANAGVTLITVLGAPVCDLDRTGTEGASWDTFAQQLSPRVYSCLPEYRWPRLLRLRRLTAHGMFRLRHPTELAPAGRAFRSASATARLRRTTPRSRHPAVLPRLAASASP